MKDSPPETNSETNPSPEFVFYYPGHRWADASWVKSLLLFFDGIALLVPGHKLQEPASVDPEISNPLLEKGLLRVLPAEQMVDAAATQRLADAVGEVIESGRLDALAHDGTAFHELSYSRIGGYGDARIADEILGKLEQRGLALPRANQTAVSLHPTVRVLILVLLAQILRSQGGALGMTLSPATDQGHVIQALTEMLALGRPGSTGNVVSLDLESVGVNLELMPLDEVLDFRRQHLREHRRYAREVRRFVRETSVLPEVERQEAFKDRREELRDLAEHLASWASREWKRPATFALGIAGAGASYAAGSIPGAVIAAARSMLVTASSPDAGPFSFLFAAKR